MWRDKAVYLGFKPWKHPNCHSCTLVYIHYYLGSLSKPHCTVCILRADRNQCYGAESERWESLLRAEELHYLPPVVEQGMLPVCMCIRLEYSRPWRDLLGAGCSQLPRIILVSGTVLTFSAIVLLSKKQTSIFHCSVYLHADN